MSENASAGSLIGADDPAVALGASGEERRTFGERLWIPGRPLAVGQGTQRRSWLRVGYALGMGVLLAYGTAQAFLRSAQVLTLVLLAFFLAVSLEPIVYGLMRFHLRRGVAVAFVLVAFAAAFAGFIALVIPPVSTEISALTKAIPKWLQEVHDHQSQLGKFEDRYHLVEKAKAKFADGSLATGVASGVLGAGRMIVGAVTSMILVITLTIYFLVGLPAVKTFGIRFAQAGDRARIEDLTERIMLQVGRYMLTNLATSVLAGIATFLWCWGVGVPYAAMLGSLVAIMDLIPVIGSTLGGVIVSLVGLAASVPIAVATAIFYVVFRFAEDHLVTPLAMRFTVRLHPVATMVAVLVGGTLLGLIGALIAVPAATAISLILDEVVFPKRDQAV